MKTRISMRKELRKQQRRKHTQIPKSKFSAPRNASQHSSKSSSVSLSKSTKITKKVTKNASDDISRLEKLKKRQPYFYSLLQQDGLVDDGASHNAFVDDDKQIEAYRKKLKLKTNKAFEEDGLDYLLDIVDKKADDVDSSHEPEDEHIQSSIKSVCELDGESDEESNNEITDESGTESENGLSYTGTQISESDMGTDSEHEDIDTLTTGSPKPQDQNTTVSENYVRLKKLIQGNLNRLSEANIETIFNQIESFYSSNPRHDTTDIFINGILRAVSESINLLESFTLVYACLISKVFNIIGIDVGALFVQKLAETIINKFNELSNQLVTPEEKDIKCRQVLNMVTLLSYLYLFNVVSSVLIYDLLKHWTENLKQEIEVELILKCIRICGRKLRAGDPIELKDYITLLFTQSKKQNECLGNSSRFKFLLEQVELLKNNKGVLKTNPNDFYNTYESIHKQQRNFLKKRGIRSEQEGLRCSLSDIQQISTKGKWWIVGAPCTVSHKIQSELLRSDHKLQELQQSNSLQLLARRLGLNTEIRRNIFCVVMSAEDVMDAYERLLKLNLTQVQQREIPRILCFCGAREKKYNQFYAAVLERFCTLEYKHKITLQYVLWDFLKVYEPGEQVSGKELRKITNAAQLFGYLIKSESLPITIIRGIDFVSLVRNFESSKVIDGTCLFIQVLLSYLLLPNTLTRDSEIKDYLKSVFSKVLTSEKYESLKNGLIVCMVLLILNKIDDEICIWINYFATFNKSLSTKTEFELKHSFRDRLLYAKSVLTGNKVF